jgi:branched-chain amino acid transport system substrate-binding protein
MAKHSWFLVAIGLAAGAGCGKKPGDGDPGAASAASATPGVTATEIVLGQSLPYSGPASAYAVIGKVEAAYIKMVNDHGGIGGRKITLLSLDDAYNPAKTVEHTRKLVERDHVAAIFGTLGTAQNTAIHAYLNDHQVPQLFVASGADKWADPKHPWTIGWQPSYRVEAKVYARYLVQAKPDAKLCVLYQNDDFGRDYLTGLRDGLGARYDAIVVKTASYEATDPTVDSQVVTLQAAGCDALLTAAIPKYAALTIRKVFDLGWKPLHFLSNVSVSITTVLGVAGLDKSTGVITGAYLKDPSDPTLADDPGMNEYRAFMKQFAPDISVSDVTAVYAYGVSRTLAQVLTQCGGDLSRANIMKQALSLHALVLPVAVPGIAIDTGPTDFRPFSQMQLARFDGASFVRFGDVLSFD